jgi:hypothetical protein
MLTMGWSAGIVLAVATQLFAIVTAAMPRHRAAA